MREPSFKKTKANGIGLAQWHWPGTGQPLVFAHATGFHGRCWDQIIRQLENPAIAFDMRGHGRSEQVNPPMRWRNFGADLAAVSATWQEKAVGIGHSMGGHALALAAALNPGAFSGLVLLDPVIMAPASYTGPWMDEHFARKRRREWESAEEMYARFRGRGPFEFWKDEVLRDYCNYALIANSLACPPEVEGSVYENCTMPDANIWEELRRVEIPVRVIRSKITFYVGYTAMDASPTDPALAAFLKNGSDVQWHDASHFIPMEQPERVAGEIRTLAAVAG